MQVNDNISQLIKSLELINSAASNDSKLKQSTTFSSLLEKASELVEELNKNKIDNLGVEPKAEEAHSEKLNKNANTTASNDWLLNDKRLAIKERPTVSEFMMKTGVNAIDASEVLYGVIGSNIDFRNWSKIMSSDDPLTAARLATGQLYHSDKEYPLGKHESYGNETFSNTLKEYSIPDEKVIERDGNFAVISVSGLKNVTVAVTSENLILRSVASSEEQIKRTAWLFGLNEPKISYTT